MTVDFNTLRLNLQRTHNDLVDLLNEEYDWDNDILSIQWDRIRELQSLMNDLRTSIATLMCTYTTEPETVDNISDKAQLYCLDFPEE